MKYIKGFILSGCVVGLIIISFVLGRSSVQQEVVEVNGPYEELYNSSSTRLENSQEQFHKLLENYQSLYKETIPEKQFISFVIKHIQTTEEILEYAENEEQVHNILLAFYTSMLDEKRYFKY